MKQPLIVLTGPTAAGKTSLSVSLAERINGEIISADSMQVYRGMDIGSAKIRKDEMRGIPHHLIDVLNPREEFHIVKFQQMAKAAMEEIYAKGKIPILVGGTGFLYPGGDPGYRFHRGRPGRTVTGQSLRDWQKKKAANISMKCWKRWIRRARRPFTPIM